MTLPYERRRSLEWAGDLLRQINTPSKDLDYWEAPVPEKLRELARRVLRHYPLLSQIRAASERDDLAVSDWISKEPQE